MASKYCPLLTCRSISEMQAALDSSNADRTLAAGWSMSSGDGIINVFSRPDPVYLLLHTDLFLLKGESGLPPFFFHVRGFCVRLLYGTACRSPGNNFDIPELGVTFV